MQLVSRDGWIGEVGRRCGAAAADARVTTNDDIFTLPTKPEVETAISALHETGDYVPRGDPRDPVDASSRLSDLFPLTRVFVDRYDSISR